MNFPFIFDAPVVGKNFIGRKSDLAKLGNMISAGENVVVYGEPGTGCMSLVREAITTLRVNSASDVTVAEVDFTRVRTLEGILLSYAGGVMKAFGSSAADFRNIVSTYMQDAHFVFDNEQFDAHGEVISMNWLPDEIDLVKIFELPGLLAASHNLRLVILVHQFQNILFCEDSYNVIKVMERIFERRDLSSSHIFTGSQLNRLREIFDIKRHFWRTVVRITPSPLETSAIVDHVYRGFQMHGKVLEKDLIMGTVDMLRGNMRYVNQLYSIIDAGTRGFVNAQEVQEGMSMLLRVHRHRFLDNLSTLTDFQLNLLKAIIDGETRFSAAAVIDKYRLNSSANVKRLKDALVKKEIVWFDEDDVPHIEDPLFEIWLRKEYFAQ